MITIYTYSLLSSSLFSFCRIFSGYVCVCVCCIYILHLLNNVINLIQLIGPDFNNIYTVCVNFLLHFVLCCVVFCFNLLCFIIISASIYIFHHYSYVILQLYIVAAFPYIRLRSRVQIFRGRICLYIFGF